MKKLIIVCFAFPGLVGLSLDLLKLVKELSCGEVEGPGNPKDTFARMVSTRCAGNSEVFVDLKNLPNGEEGALRRVLDKRIIIADEVDSQHSYAFYGKIAIFSNFVAEDE